MLQLIDHLTRSGVPLESWQRSIGPHSFHYDPNTKKLIEQYPPGNGLILSLFKEGRAVSTLNGLSICVLFLLALIGVGYSWFRSSIASAGLFVFAAHEGFVLLDRIQDRSFSVNIGLLPLVFAAMGLVGVRALKEKGQAFQKGITWLTFLSGLFLGVSVLIRITNVLLIPSAVLMVGLSNILPLLGGVTITGFIPLLIYQKLMTGHWLKSTYSGPDVTGMDWSAVWPNLDWYLLSGSGGKHNWPLYVLLVTGIGFWFWKPLKELKWIGLSIGGGFFLVLAFFLTHKIYTHYYLYPMVIFGTWIGSMTMARLELSGRLAFPPPKARRWPSYLAYLPVMILFIWSLFIFNSVPQTLGPPKSTTLPLELSDPKAWIFADHFSSSVWYYGKKGSIRIQYSPLDTQKKILDYVREQEGRAYIVGNEYEPELYGVFHKFGIPFHPAGKVFGETYYQLDWNNLSNVSTTKSK